VVVKVLVRLTKHILYKFTIAKDALAALEMFVQTCASPIRSSPNHQPFAQAHLLQAQVVYQ